MNRRFHGAPRLLAPCIFLAAGITAQAQFQIVGPAPVSAAVARQRIRTLLEKVDPTNRQQTIKDIFALANWYRDVIDEELIAAWKKDGRANLVQVMEPLADRRVAVAVVEFSWRQQRQATFTAAYQPMLGRLMFLYPDSVQPFLDDLLGSTAPSQQPLALSQPETDAVCRILLDLPDIRTFRKSALQILPRYLQTAETLLIRDLHGDDRDRRNRAPAWLADLGVAKPPAASVSASSSSSSSSSSGSGAFHATNADSSFTWAVTAAFSGAVAYEGQSLKVTISDCALTRPTSFSAPAEVVGIGVGVSRQIDDKGAWKIERSAELHAIRQSVPPGQKIGLPSIALSIPLDNFEVRSGDWLTFSVRLKNVTDGRETTGEVYAHWRSLVPPPSAGEAGTAATSSGGAVSMYVRGQNYASGKGAAQDYAQAANWFRKAADAHYSPAMDALGKLYETGRGVEQDLVEAAHWYRLSAEAGYGAGMADLGHMYEIGGGVTQDYAPAFQWYLKGAQAGTPAAMVGLALLFENGHAADQAGKPARQDFGEALKWYDKAAGTGDAAGMYHLAQCYEIGKGTAPNRALAMDWYRKAADAGSEPARARVGNDTSSNRPAVAAAAERNSNAPRKAFRDPHEFDMYSAVNQDLEANRGAKAVQDLNSWKRKYPDSDFKNDREAMYIQAYEIARQFDKVLEKANELIALNLRSLFPDAESGPPAIKKILSSAAAAIHSIPNPSPDQTATANRAAQELKAFK